MLAQALGFTGVLRGIWSCKRPKVQDAEAMRGLFLFHFRRASTGKALLVPVEMRQPRIRTSAVACSAAESAGHFAAGVEPAKRAGGGLTLYQVLACLEVGFEHCCPPLMQTRHCCLGNSGNAAHPIFSPRPNRLLKGPQQPNVLRSCVTLGFSRKGPWQRATSLMAAVASCREGGHFASRRILLGSRMFVCFSAVYLGMPATKEHLSSITCLTLSL